LHVVSPRFAAAKDRNTAKPQLAVPCLSPANHPTEPTHAWFEDRYCPCWKFFRGISEIRIDGAIVAGAISTVYINGQRERNFEAERRSSGVSI
jgi:hypothetical protein